jgi:hypothetical protein
MQPKGVRRHRFRFGETDRRIIAELCAARDIDEYLGSLASEGARGSETDELEQRRHFLDKLALLDILVPDDRGWKFDRVTVIVRSLEAAPEPRDHLVRLFEQKFIFRAGFVWRNRVGGGDAEMSFGLEPHRWRAVCRTPDDRLWWETISDTGLRDDYRGRLHLDVLVFEGYRAGRFLRPEQGTHLFVGEGGAICPIQVVVLPTERNQDVGEVLSNCLKRHDQALTPAGAEGSPQDRDPFAWGSVVAIYTVERGLIVDLRSGLTAAGQQGLLPTHALMATLPLPPELRDLTDRQA